MTVAKQTGLVAHLTHLTLDKMAFVLQIISSNAFSWIKISVFWFEFQVCSNWPYGIIGSGNGLVPNNRQAVIWYNADPAQWSIYVALEADELT